MERILREEASMSRFIEVAKQSQNPEGGTIGVEIEGKRLALVKLKGEVHALADTCLSRGPRVKGVRSQAPAAGARLLRGGQNRRWQSLLATLPGTPFRGC
jgi:hypothetical protein